jgi:hypothetical protein
MVSKLVNQSQHGSKPKRVKGNREKIRKAVLGQINRICRDRYGAIFPDNEDGRNHLMVLLHLQALHPTHGPEKMRNTIETRADWMAEDEMEMIIGDLARLDSRYSRLCPDELREKLWITTADRERLKAWNVPPCDKSKEELAIYNKAKRNAQRRERRREAGIQPRADYEARSISRLKPWESEGVSRATWYRRRDKSEPSAREQWSTTAFEGVRAPLASKSQSCETRPLLGEKQYRLRQTCPTRMNETERKGN